jgi:hypothetical protein
MFSTTEETRAILTGGEDGASSGVSQDV